MEEIEVSLKVGKIKLRKPTAGIRNKVAVKVETIEGIKQSAFLIEILPHCVVEHPWGTKKLTEALDALTIEEYDELILGLTKLMDTGTDVEKKSEE